MPAANDELVFGSEIAGLPDESIAFERGGRESRFASLSERGSHVEWVNKVATLLRGCRVFHFHDTSRNSPVKQFSPAADNITLRADAENLAAVLLAMRDSDDDSAYRRIVAVVRQVAPFFRDFVLQSEGDDRVRLRWRQEGSDVVFSANQMSDGTLRFVCLATLLLQPDLPNVVVLDEPELGLHPFAIVQLAALLRQAGARAQVLLATQSVTLMNQFELRDIIVVERAGGGSTFSRPDAEHLAAWLEEYSLGELWEKNVLGGRPGSAGSSPYV